jgi:hypothetical protein
LEGGAPHQRGTGEGNDKPGAGLNTVGAGRIFVTEGACKIGIDVTINLKGSSGSNDHATGLGTLKIFDDPLNGGAMTGAGMMSETSSAVDGMGDVRTRILGKVHQHTHNGSKFPGFVEGRTGKIRDERNGRRRSGRRITSGHAGGLEDVVEKSGLGKFELLGGVCGFADAFDVDAKEIVDRTFVLEIKFVAVHGLRNAERSDFTFNSNDIRTREDTIINIHDTHQVSLHE